MDSEAEPASQDHATLGKRKRPSATPSIAGDRAESPSKADQLNPASPIVFDRKRPRLPSARRDTYEDLEVSEHSQIATLDALPIEILQHICLFLDPSTLGRLIRVNHTFRTLLDPRGPPSSASGHCKTLSLLSQNAIWMLSRQAFLDTPEPLTQLTELEMLQLMLNLKCQYCGRLPSKRAPNVAKSQWSAGPGPEGVRVIWPFQVRSCANCLRSQLIKEQELMLSPSSALIPGLPFAWFTPSLNYITAASLQQGSLPSGLQLTKYYFRPQIEELKHQMQQIQQFAPTAYLQWYRGLEPMFENNLSDIIRIEQWEMKRYVADLQDTGALDSSSLSSYSGRSGLYASSFTTSNITSTNPSTWQHRTVHRRNSSHKWTIGSSTLPATPKAGPDPGVLSATSATQPASYLGSGAFSNIANKNAERKLQEVRRIQTQRRLDIEHRCSLLEPPLLEADLSQMKSFKAAIQIVQPLDENAWQLLKPRLLAEHRATLDQSHFEADSTSSHFPSRETVHSQEQEHREHSSNFQTEPSQRTTRDEVAEIAQEFIKRCYMSGTNINAESAPRFAAEVLEHVRNRFYEIQEGQDAKLALQGLPPPGDSGSGMRTRRLQLRHMKHVFDNCILPCTEFVQKDLFSCSGCEPSDKHFPFVGLIQHYASKHTDAFSRGTRTIHWSSQWPSVPPFRMPPIPNNPIFPGIQRSHTASQQLSDYMPQQSAVDGRSDVYHASNRQQRSASQADFENSPTYPLNKSPQRSTPVSIQQPRVCENEDLARETSTLQRRSPSEETWKSPVPVAEARHNSTKEDLPPAPSSGYSNEQSGTSMRYLPTSRSFHHPMAHTSYLQEPKYPANGPVYHPEHDLNVIQEHVRQSNSGSSHTPRTSIEKSDKVYVTNPPMPRYVRETPSKQVDDFLQNLDLEDEMVRTNNSNVALSSSSRSFPRSSRDAFESRRIVYHEPGSSHAAYATPKSSMMPVSGMPLMSVRNDFISNRSSIPSNYSEPHTNYTLSYGYRSPDQTRENSTSQRYEAKDEPAVRPFDRRYYLPQDERHGHFSQSNVGHPRRTASFEIEPGAYSHIYYEGRRAPYTSANSELTPSPPMARYRRVLHDEPRYVVVDQAYSHATDNHATNSEYRQRSVYDQDQYYDPQPQEPIMYPLEKERWTRR